MGTEPARGQAQLRTLLCHSRYGAFQAAMLVRKWRWAYIRASPRTSLWLSCVLLEEIHKNSLKASIRFHQKSAACPLPSCPHFLNSHWSPPGVSLQRGFCSWFELKHQDSLLHSIKDPLSMRGTGEEGQTDYGHCPFPQWVAAGITLSFPQIHPHPLLQNPREPVDFRSC